MRHWGIPAADISVTGILAVLLNGAKTPADRGLIPEMFLREGRIDDSHRFALIGIFVGEVAASDYFLA